MDNWIVVHCRSCYDGGDSVEETPDMSKSSLIAELNLEHRQMLELVQGFGKNDFEQAGASGAWTAKDVFGHLAYWNGEAAEAIALALHGERHTPWLEGEIDEITHREVAARREQ